MKPYAEVRIALRDAVKKYMWESSLSQREFVQDLACSRTAVMSIVNATNIAPRMKTLWAIVDKYGYNAVGNEFLPPDGAWISYEVAHDRLSAMIRQFIDTPLYSRHKLKEEYGITHETLYNVFTYDTNPNLLTLWSIADYMNLDRIGDLFASRR